MSTRVAVLAFLRSLEGIKPDQAYSNRLVDFVEKDDLLLTDLIPISMWMSVFQELIAKGAYFLSKLLTGTTPRLHEGKFTECRHLRENRLGCNT